jgi:hypothetical protein
MIMPVIGGSAGGGANINASISFAIPALLIVGAGVAVILYQHSIHTGIILNALGGSVGVNANAGLASQASQSTSPSTFANGSSASPATGIWTPTGLAPGMNVFPYVPSIGGATE